MKTKQKVISSLILAMVCCGMLLFNGVCFTDTPMRTDPRGDCSYANADLLKVWIENDNEYLRFKVEILGFFDNTFDVYLNSFNVLAIGININNDTGTDTDEFWIPVDYVIWWVSLEEPPLYFTDYNNGTNSLSNVENNSYYLLSNENHTIEIGYKLKAYEIGKGYLNLSRGQTINVVFYAGPALLYKDKIVEPPPNEDWCPHYPDFLVYTLPLGLPMWVWILIGIGAGTGGAGAIVYILWKKEII